MDDASLFQLLATMTSPCVLLLENLDAAAVSCSRGEAPSAGDPLSLSGLLDVFDGVAAKEGRLLFITTNYVDALAPALIRDGRCDVKVELRQATRAQATRLFINFFSEDGQGADVSALAAEFARKVEPGSHDRQSLTCAELQGRLMRHRAAQSAALVEPAPNAAAEAASDGPWVGGLCSRKHTHSSA